MGTNQHLAINHAFKCVDRNWHLWWQLPWCQGKHKNRLISKSVELVVICGFVIHHSYLQFDHHHNNRQHYHHCKDCHCLVRLWPRQWFRSPGTLFKTVFNDQPATEGDRRRRQLIFHQSPSLTSRRLQLQRSRTTTVVHSLMNVCGQTHFSKNHRHTGKTTLEDALGELSWKGSKITFDFGFWNILLLDCLCLLFLSCQFSVLMVHDTFELLPPVFLDLFTYQATQACGLCIF